MNSEDDIIKMLEFLVYNILVVLAGKFSQQTVGTPMCIVLYSYEAEFKQSLLLTAMQQLASRFNLTGTSMVYCP